MSDQPDHDLAAELALDLLTGTERARALRLQLSDSAFAQEVMAWRQRLAPMFDEFCEVPAPETIWEAVAARLSASSTIGRTSGRTRLTALRLWQALAITASVLAASLSFLLIRTPVSTPPAPTTQQKLAVASLTGSAKEQLVAIIYDPSTGTLRIASSGLVFGRIIPELWAIPADGKPRSLGLIQRPDNRNLVVKNDIRRFMTAGTTLAVTMEDATTAPHDAPGSTPILLGTIAML